MQKSVLLAPSEQPTEGDVLTFPYLLQPKYDGWRMCCQSGHLFTRTMLPQPNLTLYAQFEKLVDFADKEKLVFDGELYSSERPFRDLSSVLRSHEEPCPPDLHFWLFDVMTQDEWNGQKTTLYWDRYKRLKELQPLICPSNVHLVPSRFVTSFEEIKQNYYVLLSRGFEGGILRSPFSLYKHGRATFNENIIYKLKPFETIDAIIIAFEEQESLAPHAEVRTSPTGKKTRSSKQSDYEPADTLGGLRVRDETGREFSCGWGKGWTKERKQNLWNNKELFLGSWVTVRFLPSSDYNLPRGPQVLEIRDSK